jgi:hypothetical protein
MRRNLLSALGGAVALAAAGQVSAQVPNPQVAPNQIFIGGATAVQRSFDLDITLRFCNYDGNVNDNDGFITPAVYTNRVLDVPGNGDGSAALPPIGVGSQVIVHCSFKPSLGGNLAGAEVAVYKLNAGSGTGVAPVSNPDTAPAADQRQMNASPDNCTRVIPTSNPGPDNTFLSIDGQTRFRLFACPDAPIVTQAPDGGISDVEPKVFVGQLATGFGNSVPGLPNKPQNDFIDEGTLIVRSGPGIVFGVAATLQMYDELINGQQAAGLLPDCPANPTRAQRDSVACMPSIPGSLVQSVYSGEISSWAERSIYGQVLNTSSVNQGNKVNLCRRTAGSGTHAQYMVHFHKTNCINDAPSMLTFANNVPAFIPAANVYENEGSGGVDSCMNALSTGVGFNGNFTDGLTRFPQAPLSGNGDSSVVPAGRTAFALGYNSLERNVGLQRAFRFMKIDGVAPTLENAYNGDYRDIYYLSYQNRVLAGTDTPDPRTGAIRTTPADASQVQVLREFFGIWNTPSPAAIDQVNRGLIVRPDVNDPSTFWQGGFLVPDRNAPQVYAGGPVGSDPRTPWSRQTPAGTADSCQELSIAN